MTYTEVVRALSELRKSKPKSLDKLYGLKGPNLEQLEEYKEKTKAWNKEYRRLQKLLKQL